MLTTKLIVYYLYKINRNSINVVANKMKKSKVWAWFEQVEIETRARDWLVAVDVIVSFLTGTVGKCTNDRQ